MHLHVGPSEWAFVNNLLVPFTTSYKKKSTINQHSAYMMYIEHFYILMEPLVGKLKCCNSTSHVVEKSMLASTTELSRILYKFSHFLSEENYVKDLSTVWVL